METPVFDTALLDASLLNEYPLCVVGVYTPHEALTEPGTRLLLTSKGMMLESCNGVYRSTQTIGANTSTITLPFGDVAEGIVTVDKDSAQALTGLTREFLDRAGERAPNETIMLVVKAPGQPMRCIYPELASSEVHLDYDAPALMDEGEEVILDIHSHGKLPAFFSATDNHGDALSRSHLKVSYVVGGFGSPQLTSIQRWVARGQIFNQQERKVICGN